MCVICGEYKAYIINEPEKNLIFGFYTEDIFTNEKKTSTRAFNAAVISNEYT